MNNIHYANRQNFDIILDRIKQDWVENLHILADFDGTMTKVFFDWKKRPSLVSLLRHEERSLWDVCAIKDSKLFDTYHPIEIDPNIDMETKKIKMMEWWTKSFELFIKSWLNKQTLKNIVKSDKIQLRKWIKNFLEFSKNTNIPFVIISASWIWKKTIQYFLEERGLFFDNIHIISNDFDWDNDWYAIDFKKPIIHTFNKWETLLKDFPNIHDKVESRKNVILLWDSLWDHHMVDWFNYNNLLKIGFLNDKKEQLLDSYQDRYDLVLTWDDEWILLKDILK